VDISIGYWWWWIIRNENFKSWIHCGLLICTLRKLRTWSVIIILVLVELTSVVVLTWRPIYSCTENWNWTYDLWSWLAIISSYWCFPYRKIPFYLRYWYCHEKKKQYHQILVLVGVGDNRSCTSLSPDQGRYMQIWDRFWILGQARVTCFAFGKREGVAWYTMSRSIVYFCYNMWCRINIRDWLPWSRHK